jgi:hypothetical protein
LRLAPHDPRWADLSGAVPFGPDAYPPLWELADTSAYDAADASAAISRDARLAHRDHTAWAAAKGAA